MRSFIFLLLLIPLGCGSAADTSDQNTRLAKEMFATFNAHDWTKMASYYSEDAMFLDPSFGKSYVKKSRAETAAKYADMQKIFADIRDDITGIYASGDHVTVEFVSTGKAGDGTTFTLPIVTVLTFKDGAIIRDATYYDNP